MLQGERPMARDNRTLGQFHLDGIPPAPRGVPQIEVTFDIDANGILNVSAKDKATGKEQKITITGSSGLSKDEVERMVSDAEAHAAEDKKRSEQVEARNSADALVYSVEKTLSENRDKLPAADVSRIESGACGRPLAPRQVKMSSAIAQGGRRSCSRRRTRWPKRSTRRRPRRRAARGRAGGARRRRCGGRREVTDVRRTVPGARR